MLMDVATESTQFFLTKLAGSRAPNSVKKSIYLHLKKPWVPNFKNIALSPAPGRLNMEKWFHTELFEQDGRKWYFPSALWFVTHARISHPPEGEGCSIPKHIHFLTREGQGWEFDYANVLQDGSAKLLGPEDFLIECQWWKRNVTE